MQADRCAPLRSTGGAPWWRRTSTLLALIILAGVGIRLWVSVMAFASTFDTSTPGLMGLHILKGERPLCYYGQNYMGALEAYLAALLFAVLGPSLTALSLSPILFTAGWMGATYLLFRDLYNQRAGLVAALCVAVPGWDTLWYSLASYGGYPAAFFLGTLALWLVVRMVDRPLSSPPSWSQVLLLGAVAGLGLWTHYLSAIYLATGAVLLGFYFVRIKFAWPVLARFAAGSILFLIAFSPSLLAFQRFSGGHVAKMSFSPMEILGHIAVFNSRTLGHLLFPPLDLPTWLRVLVYACLLTAGISFLATLVTCSNRKARLRLLLPVLFCGLFAAMYLPHTMAQTGAPRYVIPFALMVLFALFAAPMISPKCAARWLAGGLLLFWIGFHATTTFLVARAKAPSKRAILERRERVVENAREAGARTVQMVGGPIFGHTGQTLSFFARDAIRFVSVFDERYQPSAQAAETDRRTALAVEAPLMPKVRAALDSLGVAYRITNDPWVGLVHDLKVGGSRRVSIPPSEMRVTVAAAVNGNAAALTDRVFETSVKGPCEPAGGFSIDLGKDMLVDSLWLVAPDFYQFGLPEGYVLSVSLDGVAFRPIQEVNQRMVPGYTLGDQVYLKGYQGKMACRFPPVTARHIRIVATRPQAKRTGWELSEVYVFQHLGELKVDEEEVAAVAAWIRDRNVKFSVADRWLSARLWEALPGAPDRPPVYPRFNPKYLFTRISRVVEAHSGMAVIPPREVADECEALLREVLGEDVVAERQDLAHYTMLRLAETRGMSRPEWPKLLWNGHSLLKTYEPEGLWF